MAEGKFRLGRSLFGKTALSPKSPEDETAPDACEDAGDRRKTDHRIFKISLWNERGNYGMMVLLLPEIGSARRRTPRKGKWLLAQPRFGASVR